MDTITIQKSTSGATFTVQINSGGLKEYPCNDCCVEWHSDNTTFSILDKYKENEGPIINQSYINTVNGDTGIAFASYAALQTYVRTNFFRKAGGSSGIPAGGTTGQALTKNSNADGDAGWNTISGGSSLPVSIADTNSIPFNNALTIVGDHTMLAPLVITPNTSGAVAGCAAQQRIISDGVNTPDVSAFKLVVNSLSYDTAVGHVNTLSWWFDGVSYNLVITQNAEIIAPDYTPQVNAWAARLATAGYSISSPRKSAYLAFINGLAQNAIYQLFTEIWFFEGGTAATNVLGFKNAYNGTIHGTLTHDANGTTGNGSTGYIDTGISPNTIGVGSLHMAVYLQNAADNGAGFDIGSSKNGASGYNYISPRPSGSSFFAVADLGSTFTTGTTAGRFMVSRNLTEMDVTVNGTLHNSTVASTTADSPSNFYLFALSQSPAGPGSFSNNKIGYASVGAALTQAQMATFDALGATLNTAIGR